jgi:hypothetical protein
VISSANITAASSLSGQAQSAGIGAGYAFNPGSLSRIEALAILTGNITAFASFSGPGNGAGIGTVRPRRSGIFRFRAGMSLPSTHSTVTPSVVASGAALAPSFTLCGYRADASGRRARWRGSGPRPAARLEARSMSSTSRERGLPAPGPLQEPFQSMPRDSLSPTRPGSL